MNQSIKLIAIIGVICLWTSNIFCQVKVISRKGSVVTIDTSVWKITGNHIYNKNSGNVGVGTTNPLAKWHTNGTVRMQGLATNTVNTKILTTDVNGEVTTRDWSNLLSGNVITSINGLTPSAQTLVVGNTGTDFNIQSASSTHTFNIPTASLTNRGLLSAADWAIFNNKLNAVSGTSPIAVSTASGTATVSIARNNIVPGTSSNVATSPLTLDGGATNAIVGGANATLTINNTAPLWNANQLQGRNVVTTAPTNGQVLKFNGTDWAPATEAAASNWLITGNANTTNANFLGTTNDVEMSIRSNNTTMFQVGRRQTLALWDNSGTGIYPYNQQNASVAYIRGTGGNSALQFEASGASFYKPIFFTDADGNFKMRGSSAGTDFFDLGSAGTANGGRLEFIIGDDGNEPMTFKKYNYRSGGSYKEILRLQGSADDVEANSLPRVGINVNETTPNSTLQSNGSFSLPINSATAGTFTVTELMYTIIIPSGIAATIALPAASGITGRIYIVKNNSGANRTISSYRDMSNTVTTTIANNTAITLQSDGTNWIMIQ